MLTNGDSPAPAIVVKCGGTAGVASGQVCADVAELAARGERVVLAHGGSADIERLGSRLSVPQQQLVAPDGVASRYTDAATLEVVTLALAGAVKPRLVAALGALGVPAVGLTGLDGGLLRARRKATLRTVVDGRTLVVRDNHGGKVTDVRADLIATLLGAGLVPVVSPPALDERATPVNVDADRAAAAIAGAVGAATLVLLTGAAGVLQDALDDSSIMARCAIGRTGAPPAWAHGGMALKLVAAREALNAGVGRVIVADGRTEHPLRDALDGAGTRVELEVAEEVPA